MNVKILSILFVLFLGIGFSSCSKDDNNSSSTDSGRTQGEKLREAVDAYKAGNTSQALLNLGNIYLQYQKNSSDSGWKEGFLEGATNFDTSKYAGLTDLLDKGVTADTLKNLLELLN